MEFEHSFTIPVPPDQAWNMLLDVERVAPCLPGTTVDSVEGDDITGRVRIKVGPITMTYAGRARFVDRAADAHTVTLEAAGKESRGAGTAAATVHAALYGEKGQAGQNRQTRVTMSTTLKVTGRPAQMGRGVLADVSGKLVERFATNLGELLSADTTQGDAPRDDPARDETPAAQAPAAQSPAAQPRAAQSPAAQPPAAQSRAAQSPAAQPPAAQPREAQSPAAQPPAAQSRAAQAPAAQAPAARASAQGGNRAATGQGTPSGSDTPGAVDSPGGSAPAASTSPGQSAPAASAPSGATAPSCVAPPGKKEDETLDLLGAAAWPVAKRVIPALGALLAAIFVVLSLKRRRRRKRS